MKHMCQTGNMHVVSLMRPALHIIGTLCAFNNTVDAACVLYPGTFTNAKNSSWPYAVSLGKRGLYKEAYIWDADQAKTS